MNPWDKQPYEPKPLLTQEQEAKEEDALWGNRTTAYSSINKDELIKQVREAVATKMKFMPPLKREQVVCIGDEWYWIAYDPILDITVHPHIQPVSIDDWMLPQKSEEERTVKRQFEVEFPSDLGPLWMNEDNLAMCLKTEIHIGDNIAKAVTVVDITDEIADTDDGEYIVKYPTQEAWDVLHDRLDNMWGDCEESHAIVEEWIHQHIFVDEEEDAAIDDWFSEYVSWDYDGPCGIDYWIVKPNPHEPIEDSFAEFLDNYIDEYVASMLNKYWKR